MSALTLQADDGQALHVHQWLPSAPPRATIQILHGVAEHGGRYAALAARLNAAGFAVYAADHRGHGLTAGAPERLGVFAETDGWRRALGDVQRLNHEIRQRHPEQALILLGHSMGSFMAQHYAIDHGEHIDGLVLSGTDARHDPQLPWVQRWIGRLARRRGAAYRSRLVNLLMIGAFKYSVRGRRTDFDWLSRDREQVEAYIADPLCGFDAGAGLWRDVLSGICYIGTPANRRRVRTDLPILLLAGDADPLGGNGKRVRALYQAYREAGIADVELQLYPKGRHEMFNEINREQVYGDLLAWLEGRLGAA